jgi:hypothetical protein
MKNIIKLEEMAMLVISIYLLYRMDVDWWYYLILALGPDLSMVGYAAGNKVGAFCYNLVHHKAVALVLLFIGLVYNENMLICTGLILFGHSSMDRMFGYGLKTTEGFKFTHLGVMGKHK